nr:hypothetical protein Itr_chr14CG05460 [Ipomoea trifida]
MICKYIIIVLVLAIVLPLLVSARDAPSYAPPDAPLDDYIKPSWISWCVTVTMSFDYGFYGVNYPFPADKKRGIEEACTAMANQ